MTAGIQIIVPSAVVESPSDVIYYILRKIVTMHGHNHVNRVFMVG